MTINPYRTVFAFLGTLPISSVDVFYVQGYLALTNP